MSKSLHMIVTDRQHRLLTEESLRSGLSMGEIMRRAFDAKHRSKLRTFVRGWHIELGIYRDPDAGVVRRLARHPRRVRD